MATEHDYRAAILNLGGPAELARTDGIFLAYYADTEREALARADAGGPAPRGILNDPYCFVCDEEAVEPMALTPTRRDRIRGIRRVVCRECQGDLAGMREEPLEEE